MFDKNGFYQSERITKPEFFEKHTGLAVICYGAYEAIDFVERNI